LRSQARASSLHLLTQPLTFQTGPQGFFQNLNSQYFTDLDLLYSLYHLQKPPPSPLSTIHPPISIRSVIFWVPKHFPHLPIRFPQLFYQLLLSMLVDLNLRSYWTILFTMLVLSPSTHVFTSLTPLTLPTNHLSHFPASWSSQPLVQTQAHR
jgi:hypothetical protein